MHVGVRTSPPTYTVPHLSPALMIERALLSVSNKSGLTDFARGLSALGIELLSSSGTARALIDAQIPVIEIGDYTGFPEMLDGRVKTLHPKVHGGLLAQRDVPEHMAVLQEHGIPKIDLLVVNLYPFQATIAKPDCTLEEAIENIDIGGPAMLRSAAKNHRHVAVIVDPNDYNMVLKELREQGNLSSETLFALATKAFAHTADYDAAIAAYLKRITSQSSSATSTESPSDQSISTPYPAHLQLAFEKIQDLRYGENPHQQAAFYRNIAAAQATLLRTPHDTLVDAKQWQGKPLSYNNVVDSDAAWECVKTLPAPACVIVKHANPCGAAQGTTALHAYQHAFSTDPTSAFGGIIALNCRVDEAAAQAICTQFAEVVIAPAFSEAAKQLFAQKPNVRLLEIAIAADTLPGITMPKKDIVRVDLTEGLAAEMKWVGGGLLVQSPDLKNVLDHDLQVVTKRAPTPEECKNLTLAWRIAKFVKSNAIVFCAQERTLGVGAGQMSRVDSARIASLKAQAAGLSLTGSAVASDAFFPFRDGLDVVVEAGATCVVQPGGSIRDPEVIEAANQHGIAMVFTKVRHFRH